MPLMDIDVDKMSVRDIRDKLKEMKIVTKVRRADKLREILRKAINPSD